MKKLFFLFLVTAILFGCKKDDPVPPDPPPPIKKRIHMVGKLDFQPISWVSDFEVSVILSRDGASVTNAFALYSESPFTLADLFFNLKEAHDSLKGKTYEVAFCLSYVENDMSFLIYIIKPVTFGDEVDLGNIGFSNYVWNGNPRLNCVILPSGEKFYAPPTKK